MVAVVGTVAVVVGNVVAVVGTVVAVVGTVVVVVGTVVAVVGTVVVVVGTDVVGYILRKRKDDEPICDISRIQIALRLEWPHLSSPVWVVHL